MNNKKQTGNIGEDIACDYLVKNKYKIIARNFRTKFGEIDIIAKSPEKITIFCEVKTMRNNELENSLIPEDQMSPVKIKKFKKISEWYANKNTNIITRQGYRLDTITILLSGDEIPSINHYENIV